MTLLQSGNDISLQCGLGHESIETSQIYIHADLSIKERVLARNAPLQATSVRYVAIDRLVAFLEAL